MPNINRTDDASQQQEILTISALNVAGGVTGIPNNATLYCGTIVPRAMTIQSIQHTCFGISGAPQALLGCLRFGSTSSSFVIGSTALIPAYGTSGYMSYSLQGGTTALQLQKGDILVVQQLGGTSAATVGYLMEIVVKNVQDIKSWY